MKLCAGRLSITIELISKESIDHHCPLLVQWQHKETRVLCDTVFIALKVLHSALIKLFFFRILLGYRKPLQNINNNNTVKKNHDYPTEIAVS